MIEKKKTYAKLFAQKLAKRLIYHSISRMNSKQYPTRGVLVSFLHVQLRVFSRILEAFQH
jgi:hypothetical protein